MRRLAALLACLAVVVGATACGSDGDDARPIDDAAQRTLDAGTARWRVDFGSEALPMEGEGVADFEGGEASTELTVGGEMGGVMGPLEMVLADGSLYVKNAMLSGFAGAGDKWLRFDPEALADALQLGSGIGGSLRDPSAPLEFLDSADLDGATEAGEEDLDGTPTTKWTVPSEAGDLEVWLDGDGRVRRIRTEVVPDGGAGAEVDVGGTVTLEYFDFGVEAVIEVPAEDDTVDGGPLLEQLAGVG